MRVTNLLDDDDAVSPVIGVILMVAITVILAAVIASFVLGLGNQAGQTQPQASMAVEYDNSSSYSSTWDGNITITHESGDSVVVTEIYLRGSNFADSTSWAGVGNRTWQAYSKDNNGSFSGSVEGQDAVVAGDSVDVAANTNYELRVVWEASEGDRSATFRESTGPDA